MQSHDIIWQLVKRKLLSALISSFLFSILLLLGSFIFNINTGPSLKEFLGPIFIVFIFTAPIMLHYGSFTSLLSEFIVFKLEQRRLLKSKQWKIILLAVLHILFGGFVLLLGKFWGILSIIAAIIFFLIDLWLSHNKKYTWKHTFICLLIPYILLHSVAFISSLL